MILKSGWRGESTFIDPMCGSGTLLIEAAMIALNIPPGIHRDSFAFEKWNDFDKDLFSEIYNDDSGAKTFDYKIIGTDISGQAISIAEKNVKNAGLKNQITLEIKPFQQYTKAPEPAGILMTNPPYGERIRVDDIEALYNMIGERLKHVFAGYDAYVLSFKKENFDNIGLKPAERFFLFNGPLECEMRKYEIFAGKRDDRKKEEVSARRYDRDNRSIGENKREFKQDFANRAGSSNRGSKRSRDEGRERGGFKEKGSRWDKDKGPSGDRNRGSDRDRKSHSDYKSYDRKKVVYDDATNRPVFIKRDPEDYQQKRKRVDLKKRKSENSEEAPGAEKRVNKVFIARKHPTKRKDSESDVNKETNSDNE
jgi:putative N6-adenine-specific DNA methylase